MAAADPPFALAIKNAVLMLLLVLIAHVLAKNHIRDRAAAAAAAPTAVQQHPSPPVRLPVPLPLPPPEPSDSMNAVAQEDAEVDALDKYVFGSRPPPVGGGGGGGPIERFDPAPVAMSASASAPASASASPYVLPPAAAAAAAPLSERRTLAIAPEDQRRSDRMLVGKYENESTLCGGALFGAGAGGLQGFDPSASGIDLYEVIPAS